MARFIDVDDAAARAALESAGVLFVHALDAQGSVDTALLELVLPADVRVVRGNLVAQPPGDEEADSGMGAWHVNAVDELHSVLDGQGLMQFWTAKGVVTVLVEGGDVVVIQRAEHRYRPLTVQNWAVRWAGTPDSELIATETGREATAWPALT